MKDADIVAVLTPDMVQPQLYGEVIEPNMAKGACLLFAHGFNVHYGQISPREDLDVVLVAPKGPGALVRREYEIGRGVPSVYAVHQDTSGKAEQLALTYCAGIGGARQNAIKTSFKEETETDLFGEQAVLCGGATKLVPVSYTHLETPRWFLVDVAFERKFKHAIALEDIRQHADALGEGFALTARGSRLSVFPVTAAQWKLLLGLEHT